MSNPTGQAGPISKDIEMGRGIAGPVAKVYAVDWCPSCDENTRHERHGDHLVECGECGELSER